MRIKKRREFLTNHQEHLERKQNTFLRLETPSHHKNRHIRSHNENNVFTKKKINSVHVKNHESNETELRDFRKRNVDHHLDS